MFVETDTATPGVKFVVVVDNDDVVVVVVVDYGDDDDVCHFIRDYKIIIISDNNQCNNDG